MDLEESGGAEELGEVEGGEIVLGLYCMRQEYNINKKIFINKFKQNLQKFSKKLT